MDDLTGLLLWGGSHLTCIVKINSLCLSSYDEDVNTFRFQQGTIFTVYTIANYYIRRFVVLHTCTQTLFHTQHSREMQEIIRRAHNNKTILYLTFMIRRVCCKSEHFWRSFLSSPLVLSCLTTAVIVFFVWLWQQVYDNIYNLRLYYVDSGTQQDYILSSLCNLAESVLVWMGRIQFDLCFASSAVM